MGFGQSSLVCVPFILGPFTHFYMPSIFCSIVWCLEQKPCCGFYHGSPFSAPHLFSFCCNGACNNCWQHFFSTQSICIFLFICSMRTYSMNKHHAKHRTHYIQAREGRIVPFQTLTVKFMLPRPCRVTAVEERTDQGLDRVSPELQPTAKPGWCALGTLGVPGD